MVSKLNWRFGGLHGPKQGLHGLAGGSLDVLFLIFPFSLGGGIVFEDRIKGGENPPARLRMSWCIEKE